MAKMVFPTSSTRSIDRRRAAQRGFTLVELLIGFGLASFILTGVMTTFLMMGRSGVLAQNYTELEVEARKALELFSREARMAYDVTSFGNSTVTFSIPDSTYNRTGNVTASGAYNVTYYFDTDKTFKRTGPPITNPTGASSTTTLVTNVQSITQSGATLPYIRFFKYDDTGYLNGANTTNTATTTKEIKQVELNFIAQRDQTTSRTVATATDKVLSARFILRNK